MASDGSKWYVVRVRQLPLGARHVTVLTLLWAEPWLVEVLPPLQERLCLFADHPRAHAVAQGACGRRLHAWILNGGVGRGRRDIERPTNLAVRRQMTACTRHAHSLLARVARLGLGNALDVERRMLKWLRIVAHIACFAAALRVVSRRSAMDRPRRTREPSG